MVMVGSETAISVLTVDTLHDKSLISKDSQIYVHVHSYLLLI